MDDVPAEAVVVRTTQEPTRCVCVCDQLDSERASSMRAFGHQGVFAEGKEHALAVALTKLSTDEMCVSRHHSRHLLILPPPIMQPEGEQGYRDG